MRLLIIGSSGFIGKKLLSAAVSQGMNVVTLARDVQHSDASVTGYLWSFGEPLPIDACKGITCAVHLAHDFDGNAGAQPGACGSHDRYRSVRADRRSTRRTRQMGRYCVYRQLRAQRRRSAVDR